MSEISAIVLAAGQSRRMGSANKLTMPVGGVPLLRRVLESLSAVELQEIVVVLGHQAQEVLALLRGLNVRTVLNERFSEGQMSSVWAGMTALSRPCAGVMVSLGDQPLLTADDLRALILAFDRMGDRSILVPTYRERRGNPIILADRHRQAILVGDRNLGCKRLIERNPDLVAPLEMDNDHFVVDIDTMESYRAAVERVGANAVTGSG